MVRPVKVFVKRLPADSDAQPYLEITAPENNDLETET